MKKIIPSVCVLTERNKNSKKVCEDPDHGIGIKNNALRMKTMLMHAS